MSRFEKNAELISRMNAFAVAKRQEAEEVGGNTQPNYLLDMGVLTGSNRSKLNKEQLNGYKKGFENAKAKANAKSRRGSKSHKSRSFTSKKNKGRKKRF